MGKELKDYHYCNYTKQEVIRKYYVESSFNIPSKTVSIYESLGKIFICYNIAGLRRVFYRSGPFHQD